MKRATVRQYYNLWQLALRGKIAGNLRVIGGVILQIGWSVDSRIEHENRFLQFKSHHQCKRSSFSSLKLQGPLTFRLEALPRIARGSRSVNNPSRGLATV